ncbi:DUF4397 domain-containing protein [Bacillus sp. DNRA2]|uniref:DUF4397 domain-containing protein n=1 Tax=Bacillus sp. DNRA2 TaxID=2723053 RepID=UPI00145E5924|nr:DUF4397 domain-containing protein [Bacillus sp. DNRA2]NMD72263.1 DUF4397 domain-containing protein [Bacillus sp. DNRA2]
MSQKRNGQDYFEKAASYDVMANYYKYLDPNLYIHYYKKHLHALSRAFQTIQEDNRLPEQASLGTGIIRVLHGSSDTGNIDVYINAIRVFRNLPYKEVSHYLSLPSGKYHLDIYPAENQVTSILNKRITVEPGKIYTLPMIGSENKLRLLSFEDHLHVPEGESKFRFIHLSPRTQAIDVAVVKGDVVFPKVSFKEATPYLGITPMTVDLEIRNAGTKQVILPLHQLQFNPNEVYSIVATNSQHNEHSFETFIIRG